MGVRSRLRLSAAAFQDDGPQSGAGEFADDGGACRTAADDANIRLDRFLGCHATQV
jgi:hypothetical protein